MIKILGFSGYARSGKDTATKYAQQYLKERGIFCPRLAFADALKQKLNAFTINNFGISAFTRDDEEKKIIRDILVGTGASGRKLDVNYWVDTIKPTALSLIAEGAIPIISDVRYENEAKFIHELGGKVIEVVRYSCGPANQEEAENQPLVSAVADGCISWPSFENDPSIDPCEYVYKELNRIWTK